MVNMIGELLQVRDGQLYVYMSQCGVRALLELDRLPVLRT